MLRVMLLRCHGKGMVGSESGAEPAGPPGLAGEQPGQRMRCHCCNSCCARVGWHVVRPQISSAEQERNGDASYVGQAGWLELNRVKFVAMLSQLRCVCMRAGRCARGGLPGIHTAPPLLLKLPLHGRK